MFILNPQSYRIFHSEPLQNKPVLVITGPREQSRRRLYVSTYVGVDSDTERRMYTYLDGALDYTYGLDKHKCKSIANGHWP